MRFSFCSEIFQVGFLGCGERFRRKIPGCHGHGTAASLDGTPNSLHFRLGLRKRWPHSPRYFEISPYLPLIASTHLNSSHPPEQTTNRWQRHTAATRWCSRVTRNAKIIAGENLRPAGSKRSFEANLPVTLIDVFDKTVQLHGSDEALVQLDTDNPNGHRELLPLVLHRNQRTVHEILQRWAGQGPRGR